MRTAYMCREAADACQVRHWLAGDLKPSVWKWRLYLPVVVERDIPGGYFTGKALVLN